MTMPDSFWDSAGSAASGGDDPPEPPRGSGGSPGEPAGRPPQDRPYFLDLLGDSHHGLGRHEAAIEAYREAADGFQSQEARCSHALCLFKIAASYLSLGEPWHAHGYLEACLPLLGELGLTRHEALARRQLETCQASLTGVGLVRGGLGPAAAGGKASRVVFPQGGSGDGSPLGEKEPTEPRRGRGQLTSRCTIRVGSC